MTKQSTCAPLALSPQNISIRQYTGSHLRLRMVHLHLTLTRYKGQSQGHANFDSENLANGGMKCDARFHHEG